MNEQPELHDTTVSQVSDKRIKAAKQLGALFNVFPDKNQAYSDLVILAKKR